MASASSETSYHIYCFVVDIFTQMKNMIIQLNPEKFQDNIMYHGHIIIPEEMKDHVVEIMSERDCFHDYRVEKKDDIYLLYRSMKKVSCSITGQEIYLNKKIDINLYYAFNPFVFRKDNHPKYNLPKTFTFLISDIISGLDVIITPKFIDSRKSKLETIKILIQNTRLWQSGKPTHLPALPLEIIDQIFHNLSGSGSLNDLSLQSFPYQLEAIPNPKFENYQNKNYSLIGLIECLERGELDIAISEKSLMHSYYNRNYVVLSEDSYHHVYPNGERSFLFNQFDSSESVMKHKEKIMKILRQKAVELAKFSP